MKKRPRVAVLNTVEAAAAQLITSNGEWGLFKTSAGKELLLGSFKTAKILSKDSYDPYAEVSQLVLVGADVTPEVIVAATRYRIQIGNPEDKYETQRRGLATHAFTSAATLSGTAATDRTNVYTALINKINAYPANNVVAYGLTVVSFTVGTSVGDAATNFIIGETVTQQTSTLTAKVAKCTITSGTFAADNAAGKIWLYAHSTYTGWLTTAVTLTAAGTVAATTLVRGSTNCVVTQTNATTFHFQGIAIVDDAGYFVSQIGRGGSNWVGANQGWVTSIAELAIAPVYALGIGSVMNQLVPRYDASKQEVVSGFLEFETVNGDLFDITKSYKKYVISLADGDENAMTSEKESAVQEVTIYADFASANIGDFTTGVGNLT